MAAALEITINAEPAERAEPLLGRWTDGRCARDHESPQSPQNAQSIFWDGGPMAGVSVNRWPQRWQSRLNAEHAKSRRAVFVAVDRWSLRWRSRSTQSPQNARSILSSVNR